MEMSIFNSNQTNLDILIRPPAVMLASLESSVGLPKICHYRRFMSNQKGFSLIELLIVVGILLILAAIAIPKFLSSKIAANESSAVVSLSAIATANAEYSAAYPSAGFPASLANLGPNGTSCKSGPSSAKACVVDAVLASGTKSGYTISDKGSTSIAGVLTQFVVSATPVTVGATGVKGFCAIQDNVVRWVTPAKGAISNAACASLSALN